MSQRLSKETIQSIQSQVNILDIVGQFVQLRKQGKSLFGRCPFHDERTPSFTVTEEKQLFHCFSCGRGEMFLTSCRNWKVYLFQNRLLG